MILICSGFYTCKQQWRWIPMVNVVLCSSYNYWRRYRGGGQLGAAALNRPGRLLVIPQYIYTPKVIRSTVKSVKTDVKFTLFSSCALRFTLFSKDDGRTAETPTTTNTAAKTTKTVTTCTWDDKSLNCKITPPPHFIQFILFCLVYLVACLMVMHWLC